MHTTRRTNRSLFAALALATVATVATATGCAAKPVEATGARTEKLLAPRPLMTSYASAKTRSALGITQWKIYRGKSGYVLTGYDAKGRAVKGVSVDFVGAARAKSSSPLLRARALDGSRFAARRAFDAQGRVSANGALSKSTRAFLERAIVDMGAAATAVYRTHHGGKVPKPGYFGERFPAPGGSTAPAPAPADPSGGAGLPFPFPPSDPFGGMGYPGDSPLGEGGAGGCGMDMSTIMMSAMQCLMSGLGGGAAGGADPSRLMQCVQAAMAGASAAATCGGAPGGGYPGGDPSGGGYPGGDPSGGGYPGGEEDPYGGMSPGGEGYPADPGDPYGGGAAGEASEPGTCASCAPGGGYDDIGADPYSGDVYGGEGAGGGDFGEGY